MLDTMQASPSGSSPSRVFVLVGLLGALACDPSEPASECRTSAECGAGSCVDGECVPAMDAGGADAGDPTDAGGPMDSGPMADTGPACEPTESPEVTCNGLDDDCNGRVDDVDVAGDGFCDCLSIGVLGSPGGLASASFQAWLEDRGTATTRFGTDASEELTADALAPFDILIVDNLPREYTPTEAETLRAFVADGHGLIVMTGHNGATDRPRANTLLAELGASYDEGLIDGPADSWATHPISEGVSSVTFLGGYHVTAPAGMDVAQVAGESVGMALEIEMGRAFVWGDEWIQYDSEWSAMPMITQLWSNLINWVGPQDRCMVLI
jgi:hypothetical protein